jgi:hypothetical protein
MYKIKGRPYSSTSTTAYFGSRVAPHNKDYKMNPKVAMYQTDGFGRDTYIKIPNGGFRKTWSNLYHHDRFNKMSLTDYLKTCNIISKFPIYYSNGTGRDIYIKDTCGGFYHAYGYPVHYTKFFGALREYDYDPIVNERLVKNKYDYQRYVKMFRTPKEIDDSIKLRTRQRAVSARLSEPKHRRKKFIASQFRDKYE